MSAGNPPSPFIFGGSNNIGKLIPTTTGGFLSVDTSGNLATNGSTAFTAWVAYTPTYTGFGTVTNSAMVWRRVGDTLEVLGTFTSGTTSGTMMISLPAGLTSDSVKLSTSVYTIVGEHGDASNTTAASWLIQGGQTAVTHAYPYNVVPFVSGGDNGVQYSVKFSVPISGWSAGAATNFTAPTVQTFLSGSGTYTTPTLIAPLYLKVTVIGGGGGGGGSGVTSGPNGASGSTSIFNSVNAAGGGGGTGVTVTNGGAGGAAGTGGTGAATIRLSGNPGMSGPAAVTGTNGGGLGGSSGGGHGGGGGMPVSGATGNAGVVYGGGGSGCGTGGIAGTSGGGGGGECFQLLIASPSATYGYTVGAGGAGGIGTGTGALTGGAGGSGYIIVEEFYQ